MDPYHAIAWLETGASIAFAVTVWVLFFQWVVHVEPAVVTGQHYRYDPIQVELEQGALTGLAYRPDDTNYVAEGMPLRYTCTTCTHETCMTSFRTGRRVCVHRNQLYREWECVEIVVRGRLFLQFLWPLHIRFEVNV